ncbi:MAG TPA: S-adenosylmethionine tRNA ribosyltransferase [Bacteroidetes bacterium]|nr:S-adenosylmethionine tRNA ribosyltransferase [Bacteroidota bacterium]
MKALSLRGFHYPLDESKIPPFPLPERDQARLLVYREGQISHSVFHALCDHLPAEALLVFNDTRVIPARLIFHRQSGARIEVLLLEPAEPTDVQVIMQSGSPTRWECIIGGLKKWKEGEVLQLDLGPTRLKAILEDRSKGRVRLEWDSTLSLSEVLEMAGQLPLPPYFHREAEESDKDRYQTVYAKHEGAVAAPTAGLHFTQRVFEQLEKKGIHQTRLTLHVGAGTFKPVKVDDPREHAMHNEKMWVKRSNIEDLLHAKGPVIPVGTTSMRTLESLYWWGCKLIEKPDAEFFIEKLEAYSLHPYPKAKSLQAILDYMDKNKLREIHGRTEILIYPGYHFAFSQGLITNFHLPETTLIMLVAAFVGDDWRKIYEEALNKDYRFLSFGDSSLLLP